MRYFSRQLAEQLGSAAARYRRRTSARTEQLAPRSRGRGQIESRWLRHAASGPFAARRGGSVRSNALPGEEAVERSPNEKIRRLEAVLFVAREPLSSRKLSHFAGLADGTEARTLVRRLNARYDEQGRAFRVESVAGGHQLLTRPKFGDWVRRAAHAPAHQRLSAPALETLAVIAYRQPVLRVEIEAIRGVNCGEMLRQLMDRDLVRIGGRSEELGRPYLYATTRRFLQSFGLGDLDDLPRADIYGRVGEEHAKNTVSQLGRLPSNPGAAPSNPGLAPTNPDVPEEKFDVTITAFSENGSQDQQQRLAGPLRALDSAARAASYGGGAVAFDEEEEVEEEEADDAEEDDDYDDDDEEFDDDDFDDDDFEDEELEDEEFADEEFEDEEWEEVGDDDDDEEDDDEEEEDWDEE